MKSGTNKLHGTFYEYARRQYLDANTWIYDYSQAGLKVNHSRDNFGLPGRQASSYHVPHLYNGKDKDIYYASSGIKTYESSPSSSPTINSIPNPQWLTGNFAGAQYWDATTQSLMPLTIYDPLSPLTTFVDVDGKTKTRHSPFPGNIIPQSCTPIPPATACSHIDSVGAGLFQYYNGIKPGNRAWLRSWQNSYYWIQVQTFTGRNGVIKLDQNFGAHDRATLSWGG